MNSSALQLRLVSQEAPVPEDLAPKMQPQASQVVQEEMRDDILRKLQARFPDSQRL